MRGETLAEQWLVERGYAVVARNYRYRYGEIDRVMEKDATLVFVEVKTRRGSGFGSPAEAVNERKRGQIVRAARHYLLSRGGADAPCRFDVVEVVLEDGFPPQVRHLPGVFDASESRIAAHQPKMGEPS